MDALLPAFIVAMLAEIGDRTQLLAVLLGVRFARPAPVIAGIALAAACTMALAGVAGTAIALEMDHRATGLLTGVALVLAGIAAPFGGRSAPPVDSWRLGAFASSFGAFLILEFGDKTQFVTAAIAAGSGHPALAAMGAALGVTVASMPAVLLGPSLARIVPLREIRIAVGGLLVLSGLVLAVRALDLV
jgi:putative Ca2+/H+ antiporter (TMEM165/GDT1 family)